MPTWPAPKTKFLFFDEATNDLHRVLIDTYPVTKECRAKDIFDLMLRERAKNLKIKNPYAFIE